MAGLLRRQVPRFLPRRDHCWPTSEAEAKLANAIVVEMLEFVRPIRLQVEQTDVGDVIRQSMTLAESKVKRGGVAVAFDVTPELPMIGGDHHQLCQVFHEPADERLRGARRTRADRDRSGRRHGAGPGVRPGAARGDASGHRGSGGRRTGHPGGAERSHLRSVLASRRVPASGWRSCGRSWTLTTGGST